MNREDAEEYTQSLGQIVAGSWRQIALAKRLGVPKVLGLKTEQWVNERLGGYIKLSIPERQEAVKELVADGHSNRAVGEILGVGETTVRRDAGAPFGAERSESTNENNGAESDDAPFGAPHVRGTFGTGENEWYTPAEYIDAARSVLEEIDLDPASSEAAQATVRAVEFFDKSRDGLAERWWGRVWLNPPYAQPLITEFVTKMVNEYREGHVLAAIMLTHNYTDTAWFQEAAKAATAICFTRGRIRFVSPDGQTASPTQGQAFFWFGSGSDVFAHVFSDFGIVVKPNG